MSEDFHGRRHDIEHEQNRCAAVTGVPVWPEWGGHVHAVVSPDWGAGLRHVAKKGQTHARTRRMGISKLQTPWALSFFLRPPFPCPTSSRAAWRVRVLCRGGEGGISVVLGVDFVGRVVIRLQVVSPKVLSGNHRTEAATCLLYCLHFGGVRRIWRAGYCLGILRAIVDMEYPRFYESELGPIIWQRHDQLVRPDISATVCWL